MSNDDIKMVDLECKYDIHKHFMDVKLQKIK